MDLQWYIFSFLNKSSSDIFRDRNMIILYTHSNLRTWNGYYVYRCICFAHTLRSRTILYFISQQYVLNLTTDDFNLIQFNLKTSDVWTIHVVFFFSFNTPQTRYIMMKFKVWFIIKYYTQYCIERQWRSVRKVWGVNHPPPLISCYLFIILWFRC